MIFVQSLLVAMYPKYSIIFPFRILDFKEKLDNWEEKKPFFLNNNKMSVHWFNKLPQQIFEIKKTQIAIQLNFDS